MGSLKKSSSYSDLIISVFGSSCEQRRRCSSAGFLTVNNVKCKWTTSGHNSTRSGPSDKPLHSKVKLRARTPENVDTGLIAQEICVCFRLKQVELNHAAMEGEPLHCLSLLYLKKPLGLSDCSCVLLNFTTRCELPAMNPLSEVTCVLFGNRGAESCPREARLWEMKTNK